MACFDGRKCRGQKVGKDRYSAGYTERSTKPDGEACLDLNPLLSVTVEAEDCLWRFELGGNKKMSTPDRTVGGGGGHRFNARNGVVRNQKKRSSLIVFDREEVSKVTTEMKAAVQVLPRHLLPAAY